MNELTTGRTSEREREGCNGKHGRDSPPPNHHCWFTVYPSLVLKAVLVLVLVENLVLYHSKFQLLQHPTYSWTAHLAVCLSLSYLSTGILCSTAPKISFYVNCGGPSNFRKSARLTICPKRGPFCWFTNPSVIYGANIYSTCRNGESEKDQNDVQRSYQTGEDDILLRLTHLFHKHFPFKQIHDPPEKQKRGRVRLSFLLWLIAPISLSTLEGVSNVSTVS